MSNTPSRLSLLDYLGYRVQCTYLSDLRDLYPAQRACLMAVVEELSPEEAPLAEWNDALTYLSGQKSGASTARQARAELLAWLRQSET